MADVDANRLKWRIIEIVHQFFEEHFSESAADLEDRFVRNYESLIQQHNDADLTDNSRIQHLIREFKPALRAVLQPGEHFDRLVGLVSPILNAALSRAEYRKMETSLRKQELSRSRPGPKSRVIPLYDKSESLKLLSVGIDIGSSTSHLIFSRLSLERERSFFNPSNRFILVDREILYESDIIFTPLIDRFTIDIEAIVEFCEEEYQRT